MSTSLIGLTLGQYRVIEQLGAGGMGVVYKAQDMRLGRLVALKVLPAAAKTDEESVERFRREARTASSLNHPNICTIYNFDEHNGQLYLAMELLEGEPLDRKLSGRPMELRAILDLGTQVADALDAAHSEGVLHRDIKPANIFLTRRGQVKVLDFGLAKLAPAHSRQDHARELHLTERFSSIAGTTVGTIAYMSPEQARGEPLDPRTDLFSFGVVLYEMATGRQSFPGATTAVVFDGILNREPAAPSTLNAVLPSELDRIISKALEKERTLRYQTAADMRADLQRLKRDSGTRRIASPAALGDRTSATVVLPSDTSVPAPSSNDWAATASPSAAPSGTAQHPGSPPSTVPAQRSDSRRWSPLTLAAGAILLVGVIVMVAVAVMMRGVIPGTRSDDSAAPTAASADQAAQVAPPAPTQVPPAQTAAPAGPSATPPPSAPSPSAGPTTETPKRVTAPATNKPAAATPPPAVAVLPPTKPATDTAAEEQLEIARAKMSKNLMEPALGDLRQIMLTYPGSPVAAEASLLAAEILEKLGRFDDAMAAHVEFNKRFGNDKRAAASRLRMAELMGRSKLPNREPLARQALGEIIATYPGTPQAFQALQMKIRIETERRNLRELDPVLGIQVPAFVPTLRTLTEQFPQSPQSMLALNRLAVAYTDLGQFERAAQALTDLATNFPNNSFDAWFRLGELYERRLRDPVKAREAYARVPPRSPRYRDAQRKLKG